MRADLDTRHGWPLTVAARMSLPEFVETVEWMERVAPNDPTTVHWRIELEKTQRKAVER